MILIRLRADILILGWTTVICANRFGEFWTLLIMLTGILVGNG